MPEAEITQGITLHFPNRFLHAIYQLNAKARIAQITAQHANARRANAHLYRIVVASPLRIR